MTLLVKLFGEECLQALKSLRSNIDILITKSDKDSGVVVIDKSDYILKMEKILHDTIKFKLIDQSCDYKNKRKIKKNLTNNEKKALIGLSNNNEISTCKPDKGNYTVILNRTDYYYKKLLPLLKDETTYTAIKQDQTKSIETRLKAFIFDLPKCDRTTKQQYYFLRSSDSCTPRLYGLPKVY